MPECSCRGTNPNCCRCGGWGWFGDNLSNQAENHFRYKFNKTTTSIVSRKKKHKTTLKHQPLPPGQDFIQCPTCRSYVKKKNLEKHIRNIHNAPTGISSEENKPAVITLNTTVKNSDNKNETKELIQCPYCNAKAKNLGKHAKKVHPHKFGFVKYGGHRKFNKTIPSKPSKQDNNVKSDSRYDKSYEERFADKNLGYMARDNGRYGSISLYDDYSDESDAE